MARGYINHIGYRIYFLNWLYWEYTIIKVDDFSCTVAIGFSGPNQQQFPERQKWFAEQAERSRCRAAAMEWTEWPCRNSPNIGAMSYDSRKLAIVFDMEFKWGSFFIFFLAGCQATWPKRAKLVRTAETRGQAFPNTLTYWKSLKYHEISWKIAGKDQWRIVKRNSRFWGESTGTSRKISIKVIQKPTCVIKGRNWLGTMMRGSGFIMFNLWQHMTNNEVHHLWRGFGARRAIQLRNRRLCLCTMCSLATVFRWSVLIHKVYRDWSGSMASDFGIFM